MTSTELVKIEQTLLDMFLRQRTFVRWLCTLVIASHAGFGKYMRAPRNKDGILVYTTGSEIRKINLRSKRNEAFVRNSKYRPVGIATSADSNVIYWSNINSNEKAIMRSTLDGRCTDVILNTGLSAPEILAVDWVTGNVYFVDTFKKEIGVCTENGASCTILFNSSILDRPEALLLHPIESEMFWIDNGKIPALWRAGMDGKGAKILMTEHFGHLKDLAMYYPTKQLYWIDSKQKGIFTMSLARKPNIKFLVRVEDAKLRSLAVLKDKLYWSERSTNRIMSYDFHEHTHKIIVMNASKLIYDMDIHHPSLKPRMSNPCMGNHCEELCLLALHRKYTCACKLGKELNSDLHTCRSVNVSSLHLVISASDKILFYHGKALDRVQVQELPTSVRISRISYDRRSKHLIVDDRFTIALYSFDPVNREIRKIAAPVYSEHLGGIDTNFRTNTISWTVANVRRIDQINLNTGAKTNHTFEDVPLNILSVPKYVKKLVVFKSNTEKLRIDWLILSKPQKAITIISDLVGPKISLAYDKDSERVYFADEGAGNIESFVIDRNCSNSHTHCYFNRQRVCSNIGKPVSLAIWNRKLVWTSRRSNILQWVDLNDEYRYVQSTILPIQNNTVEILDIIAANIRIPK
ncbi:vitellogenin receptor-like isoform X2 [Venturia canescens]|nr:vitellogenin receptor-like isoform X2 [Venturia canescens]